MPMRASPTSTRARRRSVDLSAWPDLVVIYLGMQVRNSRGLAAIYIGMRPLGLATFAPERVPQGSYMTARGRLGSAAT